MSHVQQSTNDPVTTAGNVIHWATFYDPLVNLFTLGQATRLRRRTVALAAIQPGTDVLDVGCGTGDLTLVAAQQTGGTGYVAGIDPAHEMINVAGQKAAQQRVEIDFRVGVIEALPFADGSFDVVLSSLMMHHLPDELKAQGLCEIHRVLRPGGCLLIVDFRGPTTRLGRGMMTLMLHGTQRTGIQDLTPLLNAAL
ncbi:MAG: methyltransferase domain-containing protein [Caldilineaceae bacterium]